MIRQLKEILWLLPAAICVLAIGCGGSTSTSTTANTQSLADAPASDTVDAETEEKASYFMGQGGLALSEGNEEEALENYLEAARIYDENGQVVIERAEAHYLAAELAFKLGDNDLTLKEYDTAVQIYLRFTGNSRVKAAIALNNMGSIYKKRQETAKAQRCWEQALELYKNAPPELQSHTNMETIEQNLSDLAEGY